jgi:hypothetical protein
VFTRTSQNKTIQWQSARYCMQCIRWLCTSWRKYTCIIPSVHQMHTNVLLCRLGVSPLQSLAKQTHYHFLIISMYRSLQPSYSMYLCCYLNLGLLATSFSGDHQICCPANFTVLVEISTLKASIYSFSNFP